MTQRELSEDIFERYCRGLAIPFERISTLDTRTPDYRLFLDEHQVIAEVKQIDPNDEELRLMRQLEERGHTDAFGGAPGHRAQPKIRDAAKQLRALAKDQHAALVVLYNNVPLTTHHVAPYAIKTAMYGLEEIRLAVPADLREQVYVIDRRFGRRRGVTPDHNTTVSAVAVLAGERNTDPSMSVYHNPHASIALDPAWLSNDWTVHLALADKTEGRFQDWHEI